MARIAILAGGGLLPLALARSIEQRGGVAHLVGVKGEAGRSIEDFPHTWVTWGSIDRMIATLRRESDGTMMIAGHVSRPDLLRLGPDFGLIRYLPQVLSMLRGGDDAVLTRVVRFFEGQGLHVAGVAEVAPELLAEVGVLAAGASAPPDPSDIALGFSVLDRLADFDVGQAVVVEAGKVLAIEGVEGTDRMVMRVAGLPGRKGGGVLVKGPKRGQDLRVDMPTVGAQTVARVAEAGLGSLVVVAGKTLMLEREAMLGRAAAAGIAVSAVDRAADAQDAPAADGIQLLVPSVVGRHTSPAARANARDAAIAAAIVDRLGPSSSGACAVVVREHVLAVSAAEPPIDAVRRAGTLRQWGRRRRRLGAAAFEAAAIGDAGGVDKLFAALAEAGIAAVALAEARLSDSGAAHASRAASRNGLALHIIDPAAMPDRVR